MWKTTLTYRSTAHWIIWISLNQTHGNAPHELTAINAARCLLVFGAEKHVRVYPGAVKPLMRPAKHDIEIHGVDGLEGAEGLPAMDDPEVLSLFAKNDDGSTIRALDGMSKHIKGTWDNGKGQKVTVISSGPMTNIARKFPARCN